MLKPSIDVIIHAKAPDVCMSHEEDVHVSLNQSECTLLQLLGYSAQEAPVADMLRQYYGLEGEWHIASPIHWEATHNDATIRYADALLTISDDVSRELFSAFAEFIAQYQMRLYYHDAVTWLIQAPHHPISKTMPAHYLVDKSMSYALMSLEETPFWLRFITESQMFFSTFKNAVNGVWIWGGQTRNQAPSMRPLVICADEHWLASVSTLSSTVSCFDPKARVMKKSVYFVPNEHWMTVSKLQEYLRHYRVRWHWQNKTCVTKPKSWLSCFMRRSF